MLGLDFVVADMHEGICLFERSLSERVNELYGKNQKLKQYLSIYERLTILITGKNFASEFRRLYDEHEERATDQLGFIGIEYEDFKEDEDYALETLMDIVEEPDGYAMLSEVYENIEESFVEHNSRIDDLASLQTRLADVAFEVEQLKNGITDPCLDVFLLRMEKNEKKNKSCKKPGSTVRAE
ncbi:hypothetical protein LJC31_00390 [Synergistaceae bacterium OttesenSCG-928-I11]|nr:hypothetical protein [Synergistaceae bacterium OttesenSCG-928-I11]